ncbi:hypothetical protein GQ43DRAFT_442560 [Delitschia confertaspora ATCC 74209]|uniref:Sde2 N-terminal ubiquitin domain-containing protein n=1 Tax=Delitschia confertaspora ATCC 74209 TaxID=1513339 RepID=A0A9P4JLI1_9PLEO|nr:hypothetical protein GQ43DRAFT_442560 [Delitschia confertaspora ATCC 74209]
MDPINCHPEPTTMSQSTPVTIIISQIRGHDLVFTLPKDTPISEIYSELTTRAPWLASQRLALTTNSRVNLYKHLSSPISSILSSDETFLPLRFTIPLCGGKGGFGSQLRAQGGRMSSRKKRNAGEANSSSRNLEGRRLRTVTEAKQLAEYLAIKPEMERKEREERMKRWQDIVDSTERKEEELRSGKGVRVDGQWAEDKEEAEQKTREAVLRALQEESESSLEEGEASSSKKVVTPPAAAPKQLFGWEDEDDEFMSDSEEEEEVSEEDVKIVEGKGKGKMV